MNPLVLYFSPASRSFFFHYIIVITLVADTFILFLIYINKYIYNVKNQIFPYTKTRTILIIYILYQRKKI